LNAAAETAYHRRAKALLLSFQRATKTWNSALLTGVLPVGTRVVRLKNEIELVCLLDAAGEVLKLKGQIDLATACLHF
jgi:hypothetical protein